MFLEGDINKWRKFAKNLKLKVLVRDFDANKQAIQALLDENDFLEDDLLLQNLKMPQIREILCMNIISVS